MSDDNIRDFYIPERPRAKGDNIRTSLAKAKKYDELQAKIEKDLAAMQQCREEFFNDNLFKIRYHNGYKKGALDTYDIAIFVLTSYLERKEHESS